MRIRSIHRATHRRELWIALLAALLILLMVGCDSGPKSTVSVRDHQGDGAYGRIDITPDYLSYGLCELFNQLSRRCGPINSEPIIKDYVGLIHQGLYHHGICSISGLNVNGTTIDIDIYFLANQTPAKLRMEAYIHGTSQPLAMLSSDYFTDYQ